MKYHSKAANSSSGLNATENGRHSSWITSRNRKVQEQSTWMYVLARHGSVNWRQRIQVSYLCRSSNSLPEDSFICVELPDRPWSKIASDIFVYQQNHYLLIADHYSKWFKIMVLEDLSSLQVINSLKSIFSKYGILNELISDNGPQYASKELETLLRNMHLYIVRQVLYILD